MNFMREGKLNHFYFVKKFEIVEVNVQET